MALAKINSMEIEFNSLRDCVWRLTNRIFIVEDFIKKKFGDVLDPCCGKPKATKRKKPGRKTKQSIAALKRKRAKAKEVEEEVNEVDTTTDNFSPLAIKTETEHFSELSTDENQMFSDIDERLTLEREDNLSGKAQGMEENESDLTADDEDEIDIPLQFHSPKDDTEKKICKPNWTHVKDFVNKEAAEAELSSEWAFKYTLTDVDGTKTTYDCKHEIGTCPAKVRLVSLNNIESVSYFTNNVDHVHSEDAKYGFNFSTKKVIDALMAEGVTEPEPMMKALLVRNIQVEQKFVNRYLGGFKKQLGLFNRAPTAKRLSYTASFKLQVCQSAEKVGNREAAREFNLNESSIRKWRKSKDALEKLAPQRSSLRRKGAKWPTLEKELTEWIVRQKEENLRITTASIRQEAGRIAERQNLVGFRSSVGWQERFLRRIGESFTRRKKKPKKMITEEPEELQVETEIITEVIVPTTDSTVTELQSVSSMELQNSETQTVVEDGNVSIEFTENVPQGFPVNTWYVEYVQSS